MALTVVALAAQPDLGVRIVAGADPDGSADHRAGGDRSITWVHVSELDDPTPFLSGGELLLTTGLFVRAGLDLDAYVRKLRAAGVLGLGFGVGLSFAQVPAGLVAAADRLGLPLLEVPRRTPFIALSRAVSNALAADEYAAVTRTFTAQQELTRAALAPDSPARLIRLLARKVDGWVVLADGRGAPIALGGDRAAVMAAAVALEVARLREHRGSVGAGFDVGGDSVSLQPVGPGTHRRAFLAVGRPGPLPAAERHLVNAAVMLLTLGLEQDAARPDCAAGVRAAVLELAFGGQLSLARSVAARAGSPFPDDPVVVLVARPSPAPSAGSGSASGSGPVSVSGSASAPVSASTSASTSASASARPPRADQLPSRGSTRTEWDSWDASQRLAPRDPSTFAAELHGELVLVAPAGEVEATAADVAGSGRTVGFSGPTSVDGLAAARDQARCAAAAAADRGLSMLGFDAIGTSGIAGLWDPGQAAAFAGSLLAPLTEHDRTGRGDLVASLRAWLAHHGQWDPAAAALGVHRHTLRRRMGLAGELLGRDLDSPTVRSELWLALELVQTGPGRKESAASRTILPS